MVCSWNRRWTATSSTGTCHKQTEKCIYKLLNNPGGFMLDARSCHSDHTLHMTITAGSEEGVCSSWRRCREWVSKGPCWTGPETASLLEVPNIVTHTVRIQTGAHVATRGGRTQTGYHVGVWQCVLLHGDLYGKRLLPSYWEQWVADASEAWLLHRSHRPFVSAMSRRLGASVLTLHLLIVPLTSLYLSLQTAWLPMQHMHGDRHICTCKDQGLFDKRESVTWNICVFFFYSRG